MFLASKTKLLRYSTRRRHLDILEWHHLMHGAPDSVD